MSNYCKNCHYNVSQKSGETACPFNYLYWDFLIRNRSKLQDNARLGMMYRSLDRMDATKTAAIQDDANRFLALLPAV
jgi:deoxyribodipyrimidine photolyase-related protein